MKYRIKQIADDIFIAQVKEAWYLKWESIDNIINFNWSTSVKKFHYNETFEAALAVIEIHKKNLETKKQYPKYHKV